MGTKRRLSGQVQEVIPDGAFRPPLTVGWAAELWFSVQRAGPTVHETGLTFELPTGAGGGLCLRCVPAMAHSRHGGGYVDGWNWNWKLLEVGGVGERSGGGGRWSLAGLRCKATHRRPGLSTVLSTTATVSLATTEWELRRPIERVRFSSGGQNADRRLRNGHFDSGSRRTSSRIKPRRPRERDVIRLDLRAVCDFPLSVPHFPAHFSPPSHLVFLSCSIPVCVTLSISLSSVRFEYRPSPFTPATFV